MTDFERNIDSFFNLETKSKEDSEKLSKEVVIQDTVNKQIIQKEIEVQIVDLADVNEFGSDMDKLAETAIEAYDVIFEYAQSAEERNCAEIFNVASSMLKNAMDAKSKKNDARFKAADLLFKKMKYDDSKELEEAEVINNEEDTSGNIVGNRNKILDSIRDGTINTQEVNKYNCSNKP